MPTISERKGTQAERWIYRCKCGETRRVEASYDWIETTSQLPDGGRIYREVTRRYTGERPGAVKCACGRMVYGAPVKGTLNEHKKCGARCYNAKGGDCDCQCAGANHGSGHAAL